VRLRNRLGRIRALVTKKVSANLSGRMTCKFCDHEPVGTCQQCAGLHCARHGKKFLTRTYCKNCYEFVPAVTFAIVLLTVAVISGFCVISMLP
jgi:hypothetical protein